MKNTWRAARQLITGLGLALAFSTAAIAQTNPSDDNSPEAKKFEAHVNGNEVTIDRKIYTVTYTDIKECDFTSKDTLKSFGVQTYITWAPGTVNSIPAKAIMDDGDDVLFYFNQYPDQDFFSGGHGEIFSSGGTVQKGDFMWDVAYTARSLRGICKGLVHGLGE